MDMIPEGYVIVSRHLDKPGVIGRASTILGKTNINIAGMQVGRINPGEQAIMVLNVDSEVPESVMEEIRGDARDLYRNICQDFVREDLILSFFSIPFYLELRCPRRPRGAPRRRINYRINHMSRMNRIRRGIANR